MRICSFLPSATEILYELGLGESVVGVTHECDYPSDASGKTVVVHSAFDPSKLSSQEINNMIAKLLREGKDIYLIDDKALRKADPDLIVAQGLCEVCSPHIKELDRAGQILNRRPEVLVLDPHDLEEVILSIEQVAKATGREREGRTVVQGLRRRIEHVRSIADNAATTARQRPRVLCLEWLDPIFTAGHWVPQMVEIAGGVNGVSKRGEASRRMEWEEVQDFDPEIIVLMSCGFNVERTMQDLPRVQEREEWKRLREVKNKTVYATDASSYFSRPGPRTVTGLEVLAKIIHPDLFGHLKVPDDSFRRIY